MTPAFVRKGGLMFQEIFRFAAVRPVQDQATAPEVLTFRLEQGDSAFLDDVREYSGSDNRAKLKEIVRAFVRSPEFIGGRSRVDSRLLAFNGVLASLPDSDFAGAAATLFERLFDRNPASFADSDDFRKLCRTLGDSIVAASIERSVPARVRALLARLAAACALIAALAAKGSKPRKAAFLGTVLVTPDELFPLSRSDGSLSAIRGTRRAKRLKRDAEERATLEKRSREIDDGRGAIQELLEAIVRRKPGPTAGPAARAERANAPSGFLLTEAEAEVLSAATKEVLRGLGVAERIDVARSVALIEDRMSTATAVLNGAAQAVRMVRIGSNILSSDLFTDAVLTADPLDPARHPGPCPPQEIDGPEEPGDVTVPTGHGEARILGMADLMLVEQTLARYELSEIAHIENVLRKEKRERRFRTATTTEESILLETETTEDKEKDLATTERFELQTESQKVIAESASKEAGITIQASYGPTVDATAKLGTSSSSSVQRSDSTSSAYARETTSRAVNRLQTRTMERRTIKTVREVEEKNLHSFDNTEGTTDISGVYRFVDKIYTAQIVNYGKRLMLEFVVPEPAAFWRHALSSQPLEHIPFANPEPPGYCLSDGRTFVPLQAQDITPENYVFWASKYGAEDVVAPPPRTRIVSLAKKGPDSFQSTNGEAAGPKISSDVAEIDIPEGYMPASAIVNLYGETQAGTHKLVIQVQDQQFFYVEPVDDGLRLNLRVEPTAKLPVSINSLRFYNYEMLVTVFCVLRRETLETWRLKTFFAIRKAYEAAKARYDNAVEAARLQSGFGEPMGRNPAANREIERAELKRACISLASGQRFETFDAMNRNVAPHGYPEIDFAEAKAEARYIGLFEQGFEWNNMTYLFYSYFWSRKDEWLALVQLADDDPLFNRFLQAGAARVQVPVRPGFEHVVLNYLSGIEIWDADGNFIASEDGDGSPLHLSIITELKNQLGNTDSQGEGTVSLTNGSDLVTGMGTQFTRDDERRRIAFGTARYEIKRWEAPDRVRLRTPYAGETEQAAGYALGPRLVGEPWEVRLPTNLVKLDDYDIA